MMHRQQTSLFLRSNSSRGSNNSSSSRRSSSSSYCSSPLSIISRRCSYNRSQISAIVSTASALNARCSTAAAMTTTTPASSVSASRPVLLSVLAWSVTLLLITSCLGIADALFVMKKAVPAIPRHDARFFNAKSASQIVSHYETNKSPAKRFLDIHCKGVYDRSLFARVERICEDCYNLFREPELLTLCSENCFTSDYFKGCIDVLLLQDEEKEIQEWIKQLHGADPGI